jgi:hypothetical protein
MLTSVSVAAGVDAVELHGHMRTMALERTMQALRFAVDACISHAIAPWADATYAVSNRKVAT